MKIFKDNKIIDEQEQKEQMEIAKLTRSVNKLLMEKLLQELECTGNLDRALKLAEISSKIW